MILLRKNLSGAISFALSFSFFSAATFSITTHRACNSSCYTPFSSSLGDKAATTTMATIVAPQVSSIEQHATSFSYAVETSSSTNDSSPAAEVFCTNSVIASPWDDNNLLNCSLAEFQSTIKDPIYQHSDLISTRRKEIVTTFTKWDLQKRRHLRRNGCIVVLFSPTNLRVKDNYPLTFAISKGQELNLPVVCLFVFDGRVYAQPSSVGGFFRKSPQRASFILECVKALRKALEQKGDPLTGIPLLIRTGYPEFVVPQVCQALHARALYMSSEYAPHEEAIQNSIKTQLSAWGGGGGGGTRRTNARENKGKINYNEGSYVDNKEEVDKEHDGDDKDNCCSVHILWDSTLTHIDDLVSKVPELKESVRFFIEESLMTSVRPTLPYNCDDGRIEQLNQKVMKRLIEEAVSEGVAMNARGNTIVNSPYDYDDIDSNTIAVKSYNEKTKQNKKKSDWRIKKNAVFEAISQHTYETDIDFPLSPLPWEFYPSPSEIKGDCSTPFRGVIPDLADLGYGKGEDLFLNSVNTTPVPFLGGTNEGLERIADWLEKGGIRHYGPLTTKSIIRPTEMSKPTQPRISPWISTGCVSSRMYLESLREWCQRNNQIGMTSTWYNQARVHLAQRDFWHFMGLKYGRGLFLPYGPRPEQTDNIPDWRLDEKIVRRWCAGLTGVPFCDAAMRELTVTGFVAKEGRAAMMWQLTRGYGQDWRAGAEWFERCSLDYDPFLCYGNSAFWSELIDDAYGESIISCNYLAHKVDQSGLYVKLWLPQLQKVPSHYIHRVHVMTEKMQKMHQVHLGQNYPYPIKLWEGAQESLPPEKLTAYFDTPEKLSGAGWGEAFRFGTKLVPQGHFPLYQQDHFFETHTQFLLSASSSSSPMLQLSSLTTTID